MLERVFELALTVVEAEVYSADPFNPQTREYVCFEQLFSEFYSTNLARYERHM